MTRSSWRSNSSVVLDRLVANVADLGFVESPIETPTMSQQVDAFDRLVTVVGRFHPWAALASALLAKLPTVAP